MPVQESLYWLAFSAFPGIGPLRFKLLLKFFGSAKKIWEGSKGDLNKLLGSKLTEKFFHFQKIHSLEGFYHHLQQKKIKFITADNYGYPPLLKEITDSPFVLYYKGNIENIPDFKKTIAVVGTRKITEYGSKVTQKITQGLVFYGMTIVSGLAYGVDAVAHQTAVNNGGSTIAVLGCGVDVIHPVSNTKLYNDIVEKYGVVLSEFPPGMITGKGLFPARNRIISGLSLGVVVTEGTSDSGSLITAGYAAEQGREVFAVPGPITSSMSQAPTKLLKAGAKLVTDAQDVIEELNIKYQSASRRINIKNTRSTYSEQVINNLNISLNKDETKIVKLLESENLHFDDIVRRVSLPVNTVASMLTNLEMKKIINKNSDGLYSL